MRGETFPSGASASCTELIKYATRPVAVPCEQTLVKAHPLLTSG